MSHAFISYVREDQEFVDRLAQELEYAGIEVWLDRKKIQPGTRWQAVIEHAIREGAFFIACFTRAYADRESTHMNEELYLAIEQLRLRPHDRAWFIPVVFNCGEVPDRSIGAGENLGSIQRVDLDANWSEGINSLVSVILEKSLANGEGSSPDRQERARKWKRIERLAEQLTDPTASVGDRQYAASTLESIAPHATQAVPALQKALADEDESVRMSSVRSLVAMDEAAASVLVDTIGSPFPAIRDAALHGLKALGPRLAYHIDSLIETLPLVPESTMPLTVSDVLASIGDAALEPLVSEMATRNPDTLRGAASALGKMDPPAVTCAPTMKKWLRNPDNQLRVAATSVIAQLTGKAKDLDWEDAVVPLAEAIREPDRSDRAFVALMNLGPAASSAIPVLIEILREPVDDPRKAWNSHVLAKKALNYIGPAAVPALTELIRDRQAIEDVEASYYRLKARYDGLWALGWIHATHRDEQALTLMKEVVVDPEEHIWLRAHAACYLSEHFAQTPAYLPVLTAAAWPSTTHWNEVSKRAIEALVEYREEAAAISELMIKILESDSSEYVKEAAAKTLAEFYPPSRAAVSALRALCDSDESSARIAARNVLKRWGVDTDQKGG